MYYVEMNMLNVEPLKYRRERTSNFEGMKSDAESEDWERVQNIYTMSSSQNLENMSRKRNT